MIDRDLAELYEVKTYRLNESVKRNIKRFPPEFMFQLNDNEKNELIAICDRFKTLIHSTSNPYAFTEHGVLMLSSILNSEKAIQINIQIIKVFNKLRQIALEPVQEIGELKKLLLLYMEVNDHKQQEQDNKISDIIIALNNLLETPQEKKQIGFKIEK